VFLLFSAIYFPIFCVFLPNSFQCRLFLLQCGPHVGHSGGNKYWMRPTKYPKDLFPNDQLEFLQAFPVVNYLLQLALVMWGNFRRLERFLLCDKLAGWLCLRRSKMPGDTRPMTRRRPLIAWVERQMNSLDGWSARSNLSWMPQNERTRRSTIHRWRYRYAHETRCRYNEQPISEAN